MFRQATFKLSSPLNIIVRGNFIRYCSNKKKPEPLCAHHKELVPPFAEIGKLKAFELKSDCTTFHMKSEGYNPEAKVKGSKEGPCDQFKN